MLYSFLDELLFQFNGDYFVVKRVVIDDFDTGVCVFWRSVCLTPSPFCQVRGASGPQGTGRHSTEPSTRRERKSRFECSDAPGAKAVSQWAQAITYSAMQIHTTAERCDVFVIVDI